MGERPFNPFVCSRISELFFAVALRSAMTAGGGGAKCSDVEVKIESDNMQSCWK